MEIYDILMLAVLVGATILGAYKGFAWQIASLASIFVSYFVAIQFRNQVAEFIGAEPPWNMFLAMLILYLGTSVLIWLVFRLVSKTIDDMKLTGFDRQIGAIFGAAKGVILCIVITLFAVTLLEDSQRQTIIDSRSGYHIARILHRAHGVLPHEVIEVLDPYLHKLDERLDPLDRYSHPHDDERADQRIGSTRGGEIEPHAEPADDTRLYR